MGQKRKNIVFFVRMAAFLIIFGLLFAPLRELVCRKSLTGTWDMTNKVGGFYNEPEDEFEILFLGSSHSYAAFSPLRLWDQKLCIRDPAPAALGDLCLSFGSAENPVAKAGGRRLPGGARACGKLL